MHNILICQDLIKRYTPSQKSPSCLLKLDVRKAYDTVEWEFLEEMLQQMRFPPQFIHLIMVCVTSPRYALIIYGTPTKLICLKRGLRQGDLLSLLLFTLCIEFYTRILSYVGKMQGSGSTPCAKACN